jgi:hypothetical protein
LAINSRNSHDLTLVSKAEIQKGSTWIGGNDAVKPHVWFGLSAATLLGGGSGREEQ